MISEGGAALPCFGPVSVSPRAFLMLSINYRYRFSTEKFIVPITDCFHICTISSASNFALPVRSTISQTQQPSIEQAKPKSITDLIQNERIE